jgi:hypothetical protein
MLLTRGPAPKQFAPVYGQAPYLSANTSTSGGSCSGLNPLARPYHPTVMTVRGLLIGMPIFQPSTGTSSSSSSRASSNQDFADDYPKVGSSVCWNPVEVGRPIIMVALARAPSHNTSSQYPTIGRSEASDARRPEDRMIWNLNSDFNVVRLQTIMESIQCMAPEGSPLGALVQQGIEAANNVVAVEQSVGNHQAEPSIGSRSDGRARPAWSEAASSISGNKQLADNDARWRITQNRRLRECSRDRDDLRNIIEDRRCLKERSPTPTRHSLVRDATPIGRGGFHALALTLRQVVWPDKFRPGHIDKYDGSNNPEEFIQVYHTVIEAARGDDRVKANYLPTVLSGAARPWIINLPEGTIYNWDQLCTMFIRNFQGYI